MDDYDDYQREKFYSEIRDELTPLIIDEFTSERLISFYDSNPNVVESAYGAFQEAKNLFKNSHVTASYCFAAVTSEVTIKRGLVFPLVSGYVHSKPMAAEVMKTLSRQTMGRFGAIEGLFKTILNETAHIDLTIHKRNGSNKLLWTEIEEVAEHRNGIVHRGEIVCAQDAAFAMSVASELLEVIFPAVTSTLGFHHHDSLKLCREHECSPKWLEFCRQMGIDPVTKKKIEK